MVFVPKNKNLIQIFAGNFFFVFLLLFICSEMSRFEFSCVMASIAASVVTDVNVREQKCVTQSPSTTSVFLSIHSILIVCNSKIYKLKTPPLNKETFLCVSET